MACMHVKYFSFCVIIRSREYNDCVARVSKKKKNATQQISITNSITYWLICYKRQAVANNGTAEEDYDAPDGIPFRTMLDFREFEKGDGIPPGDLVSSSNAFPLVGSPHKKINITHIMLQKKYLTFVGGLTHKDATNQFFKETMTDELAYEFTWLGGNGKKKLKGTQYAKTLHGELRRTFHIEICIKDINLS